MRLPLLLFLLFALQGSLPAQYLFEGIAPVKYRGEVVYLDILDGWSDFKLVSDVQPLQRAPIDSTGRYRIAGEGLPPRRGFYRLRFRGREEAPVSMDFLRRHVIHFTSGPGDSLRFTELDMVEPDATNATIARLTDRLDALNAEEVHAETPRLRALIDKKRLELLRDFVNGKDAAADIFVLGNWPNEAPPLELLRALEPLLQKADLRPGYLSSLRADIGALDVAGSRIRTQRLKWWLGASVFVNLLLLGLWWRGRRMQSKPVEAQSMPTIDLTPREEEVLNWITMGKTNKQIAERMFVSPDTVKSHINSIYKKAGIGSRQEAVILGNQRGR